MDHVITVDVEKQPTSPRKGLVRGQGHSLPSGVRGHSDAFSMKNTLTSDLTGHGSDAKEGGINSEQFFLKMGSLVALVGTCLGTTNSLMTAYQAERYQMAIINAVFLGVLQVPTTFAVIYNFLKDWVKSKVFAFQKALRDLKVMEQMYQSDVQAEQSHAYYESLDKGQGHQSIDECQEHEDVQIQPRSDFSTQDIISSSYQTHLEEMKPTARENVGFDERHAKDSKKTKSRRYKSHKDSIKTVKFSNNEIQKPLNEEERFKKLKNIPKSTRKKSCRKCMGCQCKSISCFPPLTLLRSKSVPDVSNQRNPCPHHDSDDHSVESVDVNWNAEAVTENLVSDHKSINKRCICFGWKPHRRQNDTSSKKSLKKLLKDVNRIEDRANVQSKTDTVKAPRHRMSKMSFIPMFCGRCGTASVSPDKVDAHIAPETDDIVKGQRKRLPRVPRSGSVVGGNDNVASKAIDSKAMPLTREVNKGKKKSYQSTSGVSPREQIMFSGDNVSLSD